MALIMAGCAMRTRHRVNSGSNYTIRQKRERGTYQLRPQRGNVRFVPDTVHSSKEKDRVRVKAAVVNGRREHYGMATD